LTINALSEFLAAPEDARHALAPRLVEGVGAERLSAVLAATWRRIGPFRAVADGPSGLTIVGSRGRVAVRATTGDDGRLTSLYVSGRPERPLRAALGRLAPPWLAIAPGPVVLAAVAVAAWTAGSLASWLSDLAVLALLLVLCLGFCAPSVTDFPRPARWTLGAAVAACLASAVRLGGEGSGPTTAVVAAVAVWAVAVALAVRVALERRHRLDATTSVPLSLPLDPGSWYVLQGGGRWINHHAHVPDQRGAVDLVKLRPDGSRSPGFGAHPDPAGYAAYGTLLTSPCAGTVLQAVDGHEDQPPGRARFAPPAGNFVTVDTGEERVLLAHLRPGSLRVRPGDRVGVGDPLGEVGNSGNTTEPHLHLQAERDGVGLQLRFVGVRGALWRGRRIVVGPSAQVR
jgi:hypothetical protein